MSVYKSLIFGLFLALLLGLSGCQGNNTTGENNVVIDGNTTSVYPKIRLENPEITLSQNGEMLTIKVLAFGSNNSTLNSGTIKVSYPPEMIDGNVSGGRFSENEVDIINGEAIFTLVGPNPLKSISPLSFIFSYNDTIKTTLTVNYIPDIPHIVLNNSTINITQNGEIVTIGMNVYDKDNSPYTGGNIKIKYPTAVLSGKDVGNFNTSSVPVLNGKASFVYTAPNPLNGNDTLLFTFYHDAQPLLSETDLTFNITPESGQIVLSNYLLDALYDTSMGLELTKGMIFFIADDKNVRLNDSNITSIVVTVLNPLIATLEDSSGNTGTSLTVNGKNEVQMNVKTKTLSGILPIKAEVTFKDANNNTQTLTRVFNIVVLSGPPTAMSLSYAGSEQNAEYAKFIENWVLTVTDKYNNRINTTPAVAMGMIAGYTQSTAATSNVANYLYFDSVPGDGTLTNSTIDTFNSSKTVFGNVDLVNDKLVIFGGSGYLFDTYGKWDIDTFTSTTLSLKDNYDGVNVSGLGFAVGHNFRNETCEGHPVVANVYAKDGNNILGDTGSMILQVEYDYYMVGKSVVLWTNIIGETKNQESKLGLAKKITLRAKGLTGESYKFSQGFSGVVRLDVTITDTVEYYKNANFGYDVEVTGDGVSSSIQGDSMSGVGNNIKNCTTNGGIGYVDVEITAPAPVAGEIKLLNVLPSSEF